MITNSKVTNFYNYMFRGVLAFFLLFCLISTSHATFIETGVEEIYGYRFTKTDSSGNKVAFGSGEVAEGTITTGYDGVIVTWADSQYHLAIKQVTPSTANTYAIRLCAPINEEFNVSIEGINYDGYDAGILAYGTATDKTSTDNGSVKLEVIGENKFIGSSYGVDASLGKLTIWGDTNSGSTNLLKTHGGGGNYGAGLRVPTTGSLVIQDGVTIFASADGTGYGIGRQGGSSTIEIQGGNIFASGNVGIGGNACDIQISGGTVYASGIANGFGGSSNSQITLSGGTTYALGGTASFYTSTLGFLKGTGGILYYNNSFSGCSTNTLENMVLFSVADNQSDPYQSIFGVNSAVAVIDNTQTWYGVVHGDAQLSADLTLALEDRDFATEFATFYDFFDDDYSGLSCDSMVLDIPNNGATFRHFSEVGSTKTNHLTIGYTDDSTYSKLRFYATPYGTADIPYLWNTSTPTATGGGYLQFVINENVAKDVNTSGSWTGSAFTAYPSYTTTTLENNTMEYNGGIVGYTFLNEAGHGNFWRSNSAVSVSYRGATHGSLGATATASADTYTVTVGTMANRIMTGNSSMGKSGTVDANAGVRVQGLEQYSYTFTVTPYDFDQHKLDVTVAFATDPETNANYKHEDFYLDIAGNLVSDAGDKIVVQAKLSGTTLSWDTLTHNKDYTVSYTTEGLADGKIKLVIQGINNYQNTFTWSTEITLGTATAGELGGAEVEFSGFNPAEVYIKPDGTLDLDELKIVDKADGTVYFPSTAYKYELSQDNTAGSNQYVIKIFHTDNPTTDFLEFTIIALDAGTGDDYANGQINLVSPFYQRPDGNVYAEDLILTKGTEKSDLVDYSVYIEYTVGETTSWYKWETYYNPTRADTVAGEVNETFTVCVTKYPDQNEGNFSKKTFAEITTGYDFVVFEVEWLEAGDYSGSDFSTGIIAEYGTTVYDQYYNPTIEAEGKIYASKGYGTVLSLGDFELTASIYEWEETTAVADGDEVSGSLVESTHVLTDSDVAYITQLSDFVAYTSGDPFHKTRLEYQGFTIGDLQKDNYFYGEYVTGSNIKDLDWTMTLVGDGAFSGEISFLVPKENIVFLDILENVVGVLGEHLILEPNYVLDKTGNSVYQKPDGTLHHQDISYIYQRATSLVKDSTGSDYNFSEPPLATTDYSVESNTVKNTTTTTSPEGYTGVEYELTLVSSAGAQMTDIEAEDKLIPFYVQPAGTGTSYRHGLLDLVTTAKTVSYVAPSGTDEEGDPYYTTSDMEKLFHGLTFTTGNGSGGLVVCGTDFTMTTSTQFQEIFTAQECEVTVTSKTDTSDSVSFTMDIIMEEKPTGSVTYYNEGAVFYTQKELVLDDAFTLYTSTPSKIGHTFDKWTLDEDGLIPLPTGYASMTVEEFVNAVKGTSGVTVNEYAVALYAQFTANKYIITFDYDDGISGTETKESTNYLQVVSTLAPANPTRDDYAFVGWSDGTPGVLNLDQFNVSDLTSGTGSPYTGTLTAVWEELQPYYVYYHLNYEGRGIWTEKTEEILNSGYTLDKQALPVTFPTNPSRDGYTFVGWASSDTSTTAITPTYGDLDLSQGGGQEYIFYAIWTENKYTVKFDGNGGTTPSSIQVTWLEEITLPTPSREGFIFQGWQTSTGKSVTEGQSLSHIYSLAQVTNGVTLTAQWTALPATEYTVNFYRNYGTTTLVARETSTDSSALVDYPSTIYRSGYTFLGWSLKESGGALINANAWQFANLCGNDISVNVYGQWSKNATAADPSPATDSGTSGGSGGSSSSGSSSSGSSSSGSSSSGSSSSGSSSNKPTVEEETPSEGGLEVYVKGDDVTLEFFQEAVQTGDDSWSVPLTDSLIQEVVDSGTAFPQYDLVFSTNVTGADGSVSFPISKDAMALIDDSAADTLTFMSQDVIVTLDNKGFRKLFGSSTGDLTLNILPIFNSDAYPAYQIQWVMNGKEVSVLPDGMMKISFAFQPSDENLVAVDGKGNIIPFSLANGEYMQILTQDFGIYSVQSASYTGLDSANTWATPFIAFMESRGLYELNPNLSMDDHITRGMFVAILASLEQADLSKVMITSQFTDTDSVYKLYIEWAYAQGIVTGKTEKTFGTDDLITREEMAVMLSQYLQNREADLEESKVYFFTDQAKISTLALYEVDYIHSVGLILGKEGNYFDPENSTTYGEHAVMIQCMVAKILDSYTVQL